MATRPAHHAPLPPSITSPENEVSPPRFEREKTCIAPPRQKAVAPPACSPNVDPTAPQVTAPPFLPHSRLPPRPAIPTPADSSEQALSSRRLNCFRSAPPIRDRVDRNAAPPRESWPNPSRRSLSPPPHFARQSGSIHSRYRSSFLHNRASQSHLLRSRRTASALLLVAG